MNKKQFEENRKVIDRIVITEFPGVFIRWEYSGEQVKPVIVFPDHFADKDSVINLVENMLAIAGYESHFDKSKAYHVEA
jgi:hypothetical protein